MVRVFVLNVPEFEPLVSAAKADGSARIAHSDTQYTVIESDHELVFNRKEMRLKPAVWYGIFTAGIEGKIVEFGREIARVVDDSGEY